MKMTKATFLPVGIVLAGIGLAGTMIMTGGQAEKGDPTVSALLVETVTAVSEDLPIPVRGNGVVAAAQQVALIPQVSGSIVSTDPRLMPGGRFEKGEVIAQIDARDYRAMRDQAASGAQRAELELALERGRADVAAREWEMVNADGTSPTDLALRKPQLALAEQSVVAARGALTRADLNVQRTRLRAPFNAVVVSENIDVGQVVAPGSVAVNLVGTDQLWVTVSLSISSVDVLQFSERDGQGSSARVLQRLADGRVIERHGHALQLGGTLDPQTRSAMVTVAIEEPFDSDASPVPLLPGAYVEVVFDGLVASSVVRVARAALSDGNTVWVAADGQLDRREVSISGGDTESVLVSSGLKAGDEIIVSALSLPFVGTPVVIAGRPK
jgi:RND family efflux transporter MFP subunit